MSAQTTERMKDYGIAAIRVMVGVVFVAHAWMKIFSMGFGGFEAFLAQAGVPLPFLSALLAIAAEGIGGLALVLGLGTRLVAAPLAFTMLVAVLGVHLSGGFFAPAGFEYPLTLLVASVGLGLTGSGAFALDSLVFPATSQASVAPRTVGHAA